ncbi:MAG TPA: serine hydrolase [Caulifigura sp.]|nr:serine hydrolase [Caulifigura sp.]
MRRFTARLAAHGWTVWLVAICVSAIGDSIGAADRFEWQTATPESQGMSSDGLQRYRKGIEKETKALLVIRNDRVVLEWYADGVKPTDKQGTASLAKALVGGLSLAVAMNDGLIQLDDPAWKYVPEWKNDPLKSKITVRQLGSHTSGLSDSSVEGFKHTDEPGWKGTFWKRLPVPDDPFTLSRDQAGVLFEPGTKYQYSNPGIGMLTYAVTAALKNAPIKDVRALLRQRIMRPIGVADNEWSVGYGQTFVVNGLPLIGSWGGGAYTPRAAARIGRLLSRRGDWEGTRLLSEEAVRQIVTDAGLPENFGMGFWTNNGGRFPDLPRDMSWGSGKGQQTMLICPSQNLILVRNGAELSHDGQMAAEVLFDPLFAAITKPAGPPKKSVTSLPAGSPPYPPSPVIDGIDWTPASQIIRAADGSDNWPLTWADDGHLYGAYGDGKGFVPFVERKLSMGLARIEDGPESYRGVNIRSSDLEQIGDGARGRKASGLLMVDGVLSIWIRNAGNSLIAQSHDHGLTWRFADWKWTESFGSPSFLNFGRNYAGARDEFVYVYSADANDAYEPADHMILSRVPKHRLMERDAYEFFAGVGTAGNPKWSRDLADRAAVFQHPRRCYRQAITWNAGLKRYLWVQILPESTDSRGPRFQGGLGVYDAPEPWGPWTTAYFTNNWDVGPGETGSFPTKWMSDDGETAYYVSSGDDSFSVRKAQFRLKH